MENFRSIRFVLIYTMILNLLATVAKLAVGYYTGALSLIADGFDSFFDSVSNVVGLVAIYLSRRPPDEDHPYGHRRYEILMTLIVAVMLFATCFQLLKTAHERLVNPVEPEVNLWTFASLALSIGLHLYVASYEKRKGQELKSEFLIADALHTRADVFVSVGVMAGLVLTNLGYPIIDTIAAVVVAFMIARIGFEIIRSGARILTDTAIVDVDRVAEILQQIPGVESFHHIRSRGQEDDVHLDLHIRVAPDLPLSRAHEVAHAAQRRIQAAIPGARDVIIHVEPQHGATALAYDDLSATIQDASKALGLSIHHLNAYEVQGKYAVDLHVEIPGQQSLSEAHEQASRLEQQIRERLPSVQEISTHIEPVPRAPIDCAGIPDDAQVIERVRALAMQVSGVQDCHEVLVQRSGNAIYLRLHCTLDEHLPVDKAHDAATLIEDRLRREFSGIADVSIHVEPAPTPF